MAHLSHDDEIIEEIHAVRLRHAADCGFDIERIIDDLRASEKVRTEQGWPLLKAPAMSSDRKYRRSRR